MLLSQGVKARNRSMSWCMKGHDSMKAASAMVFKLAQCAEKKRQKLRRSQLLADVISMKCKFEDRLKVELAAWCRHPLHLTISRTLPIDSWLYWGRGYDLLDSHGAFLASGQSVREISWQGKRNYFFLAGATVFLSSRAFCFFCLSTSTLFFFWSFCFLLAFGDLSPMADPFLWFCGNQCGSLIVWPFYSYLWDLCRTFYQNVSGVGVILCLIQNPVKDRELYW